MRCIPKTERTGGVLNKLNFCKHDIAEVKKKEKMLRRIHEVDEKNSEGGNYRPVSQAGNRGRPRSKPIYSPIP
jgi:hypothetical protein